jgi:drug/metabolite transporter (DMT)-like permease
LSAAHTTTPTPIEDVPPSPRWRRLRPRSPGRIRLLAEAGLVTAALIWGFNFILVKMAIGQMPPVYYVGLRFLVGAVFLVPFSWRHMRRLSRQGWLIGLGVGVLLFGGFVLQTVGLTSTSPGVSGFLTSLYVIMVPIFIGLATGRWPSPMVWAGVVVVTAGFAVLALYGELAFGWGEVFTLLATVFWALHILGVAYGSTRMNAVAFVQLQLATCAVLSLAGSFAFERPLLFPGWEATGAVLWTGVMGSLVAYVLMVLGQRYTPPTLAGVLMSLEAVFALVFSLIVGYDTLTARTLLGFAIVFAGTTVARIGSEKAPELAAEQAPPAP